MAAVHLLCVEIVCSFFGLHFHYKISVVHRLKQLVGVGLLEKLIESGKIGGCFLFSIIFDIIREICYAEKNIVHDTQRIW